MTRASQPTPAATANRRSTAGSPARRRASPSRGRSSAVPRPRSASIARPGRSGMPMRVGQDVAGPAGDDRERDAASRRGRWQRRDGPVAADGDDQAGAVVDGPVAGRVDRRPRPRPGPRAALRRSPRGPTLDVGQDPRPPRFGSRSREAPGLTITIVGPSVERGSNGSGSRRRRVMPGSRRGSRRLAPGSEGLEVVAARRPTRSISPAASAKPRSSSAPTSRMRSRRIQRVGGPPGSDSSKIVVRLHDLGRRVVEGRPGLDDRPSGLRVRSGRTRG